MEKDMEQVVLYVPKEKMLDIAEALGQIEGVVMIPNIPETISHEPNDIDRFLDEAETSGRIIGENFPGSDEE